jgi:hypothetical protein
MSSHAPRQQSYVEITKPYQDWMNLAARTSSITTDFLRTPKFSRVAVVQYSQRDSFGQYMTLVLIQYIPCLDLKVLFSYLTDILLSQQ